MGVLCLYQAYSDDGKSSAYCKCKQWLSSTHSTLRTCHCGEEDCLPLVWSWDTEIAPPETQISAVNVLFHPVYSQGTSVVRGNCALEKQQIHYWEIKIMSCFAGTDLVSGCTAECTDVWSIFGVIFLLYFFYTQMIGIGTDKVDLMRYKYVFMSVLGLDQESWGYSYRGLIQNNSQLKSYGKKFMHGCIVGVYLDLFKGHLEFFINRRLVIKPTFFFF